MKKKLILSAYFLVFCAAIISIQDFCHKRTQGFTLAKSTSSCKLKEKITLSSEELASIRAPLNQPFHFMKKGLQCYAFLSEDNQYVLKLLRWKELEMPFWTHFLPDSWTTQIRKQKLQKKEHDFTSYQIAFDDLKEESGLIYLHLSKTEGLNTPLCLYDPIQIKHSLFADDIEFILQKKADLFLPYFEKNKNNEKEMFSFFSSFVKLLQNRVIKKISDSDISLEYNMGVSNGKPILFDIGNLTRITALEPNFLQKEMNLSLSWLQKNSPHLAHFLENLALQSESSEEKRY